MMRMEEILVIVLLLCAVMDVRGSQQEREENMNTTTVLSKQITEFAVTNVTISEAVQKLRQEGIRISFEEKGVGNQQLVRDEAGAIRYNKPKVSISLKGVSVQQILDALVRQCPDYTVNYHKATDMVTFLPKEKSLLSWRIQRLSREKVPLRNLFEGEDDPLQIKRHNVMFVVGRGNLSWLDTPITVSLEDAAITDCLAIICSKVPGMCYNVTKVGQRAGLALCFVNPVTPMPRTDI